MNNNNCITINLTSLSELSFILNNNKNKNNISRVINDNFDFDNTTNIIFVESADQAILIKQEIEFFNSNNNNNNNNNFVAEILLDDERLPYDNFLTQTNLLSQRFKILNLLLQNKINVLIVPILAAFQRFSPLNFLAANSFQYKVNDKFDLQSFNQQMQMANYSRVNQVVSVGEYAIRGSIVDIFPMGSNNPFRLDLFDDEIETIKIFDVETQRSIKNSNQKNQQNKQNIITEINLFPLNEFSLNADSCEIFLQQFANIFHEKDYKNSEIYQQISHLVNKKNSKSKVENDYNFFAGIQSYLPLFFENLNTATLFDYLQSNANKSINFIFTNCRNLQLQIKNFIADLDKRYNFLTVSGNKFLLSPEYLYLTESEFFDKLDNSQNNKIFEILIKNSPENLNLNSYNLSINKQAKNQLQNLQNCISNLCKNYQNIHFLFCCQSQGRQETLYNLLQQNNIANNPKNIITVDNFDAFLKHISKNKNNKNNPTFAITTATIQHNFYHFFHENLIIFFDENTIFANVKNQQTKQIKPQNKQNKNNKNKDFSIADKLIKNLSELHIGDAVVHLQHGVGRFQGLVKLENNPNNLNSPEFLEILYADNAKLFVPISQLDLISRYSGADAEHTPLHKLGSNQWEKAKRKAAEQAHDTAAELLQLYAKRSVQSGHAFDFDWQIYNRFCDTFEFSETADQNQAIQAVLQDMQSAKPMDRLVCGDVGFGKTEVALRAAFCAVLAGKQVAILCPTTLLSHQHYETFWQRFNHQIVTQELQLPIKIAELSSLSGNSKKENQNLVEKIQNGEIDIVIGTHKLISSKINFKNLGLIIIDEEHRFGVRQKEQLKALRANVDVLTLTATPIPRTLAMSMEGLRDFSVIATAPQKRLAIKTFVLQSNSEIIKEAILRELKRGGQIYFVYNDVASMDLMLNKLNKILEDTAAKILMAHGQMPKSQLESVMREFTNQRCNVLLCSTIIETGLDNPHANTIIIYKADKFGMAQLHQLRGRVGRSYHQAYAYLFIENEFKHLTKQAQSRLEAIQQSDDLGAGFYLAMHDLEIRGAGEVLGDNQSGAMQEIGFSLYTKMLKKAVDYLQNNGEVNGDLLNIYSYENVTEINLHTPTLLPENYCEDIHERLTLYKRLSDANSEDELILLQEEFIDRFGKLPPAAQALIIYHKIKLLVSKLKINKIDITNNAITLQFTNDSFAENSVLSMPKIIQLLQAKNSQFKILNDSKSNKNSSQKLKYFCDVNQGEILLNVYDKFLAIQNLIKKIIK